MKLRSLVIGIGCSETTLDPLLNGILIQATSRDFRELPSVAMLNTTPLELETMCTAIPVANDNYFHDNPNNINECQRRLLMIYNFCRGRLIPVCGPYLWHYLENAPPYDARDQGGMLWEFVLESCPNLLSFEQGGFDQVLIDHTKENACDHQLKLLARIPSLQVICLARPQIPSKFHLYQDLLTRLPNLRIAKLTAKDTDPLTRYGFCRAGLSFEDEADTEEGDENMFDANFICGNLRELHGPWYGPEFFVQVPRVFPNLRVLNFPRIEYSVVSDCPYAAFRSILIHLLVHAHPELSFLVIPGLELIDDEVQQHTMVRQARYPPFRLRVNRGSYDACDADDAPDVPPIIPEWFKSNLIVDLTL
jgi:hypothetical protein